MAPPGEVSVKRPAAWSECVCGSPRLRDGAYGERVQRRAASWERPVLPTRGPAGEPFAQLFKSELCVSLAVSTRSYCTRAGERGTRRVSAAASIVER